MGLFPLCRTNKMKTSKREWITFGRQIELTFLEYSTLKMQELRSFETSLSIYRPFVSFRPVEFSRGRLGASLFYSDSDSGLAGETKQISLPCSLTYTVGPSASLAWFVTGQKPINTDTSRQTVTTTKNFCISQL